MNSSEIESEVSSSTSNSSDEKIVKRRGRPRKYETQNVARQKINSIIYNSPLGHHYVTPVTSQTVYKNPLTKSGFFNISGDTSSCVMQHYPPMNCLYEQNKIPAAPQVPPSMAYHRPPLTSGRHKSDEFAVIVKPKRTKRAASVVYKPTQIKEDENVDADDSLIYEEEDNIEKLLQYDAEKDSFLVKFRYRSYIHCDYVHSNEIKKTKGGAIKVKRFRASAVPFDPDFVKVDRVIHEDYKNGKVYIVKWKKLPYENCTEELAEDIMKCENFEDELRKYRDRKKMRMMRYGLDWRPSRDAQVKYESSPEFKDDHKLREYQLEGLNWLLNRWYYKVSCIMADEMGLGKTVQSVVFINSLFTQFDYAGPVLVVAPLSTIVHWEREFTSWTDLRVLIYHGSIPGRDIIASYEFFLRTNNSSIRLFDVMITTYEMVMFGYEHISQFNWAVGVFGYEHISQFNWAVGVFDEAHRLKNSSSRAASTLRNINFNHKVLLSGTPLQNNLKELWSLLNFISPQEFGDSNAFLNTYKLENGNDVERLQLLLRPLMLRRMKEDVEKTIPMKEETIIEVELTMIQKRYYRAILEKNLDFLTKGGKESAPNLLNAMMELRKCCIHPFLIVGAEEKIIGDYLKRKKKEAVDSPVVEKEDIPVISTDVQNVQNIIITPELVADIDEYYKILIQSSGKLVLLDKLLNKLYGSHKVLVFSQMTKCLDLLAEYLAYKKYNFERIDGGVRGELRQAAIDRFSDKNSDGFVFLLCTRAGGVGINLTAADTVIIFDSDWNPQNDLQAQARCHRIGQLNEVKIYRLVTRNTYEREMFDKAGMKLGLDRAVLQKMTFEGQKNEKVKKKDAIEILLRKGAYGVLMETDEASKKFCEEDIDQILERRTKVIKHSDGGNVFSKASFQVDEEIDDPHFWDNLLNKRKNVENEGRVKRQMRRISRDNGFSKDELKEIKEYLDMQLDINNDVNFSENICLHIFLTCLKDGLVPLGLKFDKEELVQVDSKYKFSDMKLYFKYVMKYLIDQISVEKLRADFLYCLKPILDENYDPSLFEKYKSIYTKYGEKCLLRVQILFIMNHLLQTEQLDVEKTKGWTKDDDKELIDSLFTNGYGNYPNLIRNKSPEDSNQRLRKIVITLNSNKEMTETENAYYKAIMKFGRVTELNETYVLKFLQDKDINGLKENINSIMNSCKRTRSAREIDCYDRISFFDSLTKIVDIPNVRKSNMPKDWNKEKDYKMKDYLMENGLVDIKETFGISEDVCIKRCEAILKAVATKEEN